MKLTLDVGSGPKPKGDINLDVIPNRFCDVAGDAQHLPFRGSVFSGGFSSQVLEHLENPHMALREMRRVLQGGGEVIIDVPKKGFTNNSIYYLLFFVLNLPISLTPRHLKWLLWQILKVKNQNVAVFHKHIISKEVISKHFKIVRIEEFGDILYYLLNKGKRGKQFKNKPKVNTANMFFCRKEIQYVVD